ncbi:Phosducin-domain-containing protein [Syncephalis plumigaleata]|nr:Phosducin-domain-containing protein [Syncephalis plumigaleata]
MDEKLLAAISQQSEVHDKERVHASSDEEDSDDDSVLELSKPRSPLLNQTTIAERTSGRQTGPKGVLADYAEHRRIERERQAADRLAQQGRLGRYECTATTSATTTKAAIKNKENGDDEEEDEELRELMAELELEDFEQDDALKSYREMRMREMKAARPTFGDVLSIGQHNYVDAIDKEAKLVSILVYLYEPNQRASQQLNDAFTLLARKYIYAKFLRIRGQEADSSFDQHVMPGLLCYRGGLLVGNWMRIDNDIVKYNDAPLSMETLEAFLRHHNIVGDGDKEVTSIAGPYTSRQNNEQEDDEDDDDI